MDLIDGSNAFNYDTQKNQEIDDMNAKVLEKLISLDLLHPALGHGPTKEIGYIRKRVNQIFQAFQTSFLKPSIFDEFKYMGEQPITSSPILFSLFRDFIANKVAYPLIHYISDPGDKSFVYNRVEILNQHILSIVIKFFD